MSPRDCKAPYKGLYGPGLPGAPLGAPEPEGSPPGGPPGDDSGGSGAPGGAPGSPIQSLVWSLTILRGHFLPQPILSKRSSSRRS